MKNAKHSFVVTLASLLVFLGSGQMTIVRAERPAPSSLYEEAVELLQRIKRLRKDEPVVSKQEIYHYLKKQVDVLEPRVQELKKKLEVAQADYDKHKRSVWRGFLLGAFRPGKTTEEKIDTIVKSKQAEYAMIASKETYQKEKKLFLEAVNALEEAHRELEKTKSELKQMALSIKSEDGK